MIILLAKIMPLAIGAMISPVMLTITLLVLSGKNFPKPRAFAFLIGAVLALLMMSIIGYEFGQSHQLSGGDNTSSTSATIDIVLGLLLIFTGIFSYFKKEEQSVPVKKNDDKPNYFRWIIVGFALNIFNDSMLFVLAASKEIGSAGVVYLDKIILILIVSIFELLPIIFPLGLYLIFQEKAKKILTPINTFVGKYSKVIGLVIFLLFGAYVLYRGIKYF